MYNEDDVRQIQRKQAAAYNIMDVLAMNRRGNAEAHAAMAAILGPLLDALLDMYEDADAQIKAARQREADRQDRIEQVEHEQRERLTRDEGRGVSGEW
jgi:hypothetical protein